MIKLKKSATLANYARPELLDRCILTILFLFIVLTSLPSQGILTSSTGNGLEEIRPTIASSTEKLDVVGSVDRPPPEIPGLIPIATFDKGRSYRTVVGSYSVLSLKGSWREMGRQYGALLSKELKEFYGAISADLKERGRGQENLDNVHATFQTYTPEMKQPIEGMSETSGLSFEEHIMLDASFYILPDLVIEAAQAMASCSGIAVSSPQTSDGKLYFARNWDMTQAAMKPYLRYMALVVFNPTDGGLSFANVRPIGQVYVETGTNEKGVFIELNNGSASDPNINENAVFSVASLFDFLRTSETLDEMVQNIVTTKMEASYIIQAASSERAVSIEKPTFDARVIEQQNGALYALNNFARPTYEPRSHNSWILQYREN